MKPNITSNLLPLLILLLFDITFLNTSHVFNIQATEICEVELAGMTQQLTTGSSFPV